MKKAVAIKYLKGLPAPFILAKGKQELAERILKIAAENDIHILEEGDLADRLFIEQVGSYIPEEVYDITAEVLAFVYNLNSGARK